MASAIDSTSPNPSSKSRHIAADLVKSFRSTKQAGLIGIDIGSRYTKLAQIAWTSDGAELIQAAILPTAVDYLTSPTFFRDLESCIRGSHFRDTPIACILPDEVYFAQRVQPTDDSPEQVSKAITNAFSRQQNLDAKSAAIEFWPLPKTSQAEPTSYFSVSVRREIIERLNGIAWKQGIDVAVIDSPLFSSARLASAYPSQDETDHCVIDWGDSALSMHLIENGIPIFSRKLRHSGLRDLYQCVGEHLKITKEEAEALLRRVGLQPTNTKLAELISEATIGFQLKLQSELERTRSYLQAKLRTQVPEVPFLIGGGASLPCSDLWMQERLFPSIVTWGPNELHCVNHEHEPKLGLLARAISLSSIQLGGDD